ncbi:hypothetical protein B0H13DRAFT_2478903 [Mycena leptocephala]|nr:hypothetical protein B0H13DRAFT_2478903 [Mycena leptocephala]
MLSFSSVSMLLPLFLVLLAPIRSSAAPLSFLNSTAPSQYLENAITARFMNQQFAVWRRQTPAPEMPPHAYPVLSQCASRPGFSLRVQAASPNAVPAATSLAARRFHRRQIASSIAPDPATVPAVSVNGLSSVPISVAATTAAVPSVSAAASDPSITSALYYQAPLPTATLPAGVSSAASVPAASSAVAPSDGASTVIGADGLPTALVVVTVSATGALPASATLTAVSSPSAAIAGGSLPPDPTSIAFAFGAIPAATSTLTVTAGATAPPVIPSATTPAAEAPVASPSVSAVAVGAPSASVPSNPASSAAASSSAVPPRFRSAPPVVQTSPAVVPTALPNPANTSSASVPAAIASASVAAASVPVVASASVDPASSALVPSLARAPKLAPAPLLLLQRRRLPPSTSKLNASYGTSSALHWRHPKFLDRNSPSGGRTESPATYTARLNYALLVDRFHFTLLTTTITKFVWYLEQAKVDLCWPFTSYLRPALVPALSLQQMKGWADKVCVYSKALAQFIWRCLALSRSI